MDTQYPELQPINEDKPAGIDVRYEPEFEQLQAEIDKMSLPSATTGVDWHLVRQLSSDILSTRSKDLLVAAYFTIAGIHVNRIKGFADGLQVFDGLLAEYWDTLYPAKKRMRGRVAAVVWLLEKSEAAFEAFEPEPCEPDFLLSLRESVSSIDGRLQEYLDEAPLLRPLERVVENLPVKEIFEKEMPVGQEQQTDEPALENKAALQVQKNENPPPAVPEVAEEPEKKAEQTVRVAPAAAVETTDRMSAAEVEKLLRGAFQTVRQAADFYFDKDPANPRGYRCRRVAGWSMIQVLPPAEEYRTQIPPPGEFEQVKLYLYELRSLEKWTELLREAEQKFKGALLWLDLNRFAAESLAGLGLQFGEAHDAVCQETASLLNRLPGLAKLTFADGSPMADADTKQWLEGLSGAQSTTMAMPAMQTMTHGGAMMAELFEKSQNLAAAKKLPEAIALLTKELQSNSGGRDRLLWRIGLARLLMNNRQMRYALPHLEQIMDEVREFRLEEWDPALAIQALRVVWAGFKNEKSARERADGVLARIARIDPVEAMNLERK
ncbi:type VI secretion system protein TssA [Desulfopila sp. IMCC35008]|uniref:type VI secretion system protein TssA n=1 Tax=Desulfopila sp. IMCC35008 TaxID=2653858 RepID=UPI0013D80D10|nr:type VI secretion system protein TssA [Desulfopila sp. IMCC35008]